VREGEFSTLKAASLAMPAGRSRKKRKSGSADTRKEDRIRAHKALSALVKALDALGVYDEFQKPLDAIAARLKQI
jgi:hypothetical protein